MESGGESNTDHTVHELNVMIATGDLPASYYSHLHNKRTFGGTSTVWSGWCGVLEKRAFLNGEWLFGYDESRDITRKPPTF